MTRSATRLVTTGVARSSTTMPATSASAGSVAISIAADRSIASPVLPVWGGGSHSFEAPFATNATVAVPDEDPPRKVDPGTRLALTRGLEQTGYRVQPRPSVVISSGSESEAGLHRRYGIDRYSTS